MAKTKLEIQKEYEKKTNYAAQKKYQKEKTKNFNLRLFPATESDIIEKLDSVKNKSGYVKQLIRDDINKGNNKLDD